MTYGEICDKFMQTYKEQVPISDYRPIAPIFTDDLKNKVGIVIWLENGDTVLYFPKENKQ